MRMRPFPALCLLSSFLALCSCDAPKPATSTTLASSSEGPIGKLTFQVPAEARVDQVSPDVWDIYFASGAVLQIRDRGAAEPDEYARQRATITKTTLEEDMNNPKGEDGTIDEVGGVTEELVAGGAFFMVASRKTLPSGKLWSTIGFGSTAGHSILFEYQDPGIAYNMAPANAVLETLGADQNGPEQEF